MFWFGFYFGVCTCLCLSLINRTLSLGAKPLILRTHEKEQALALFSMSGGGDRFSGLLQALPLPFPPSRNCKNSTCCIRWPRLRQPINSDANLSHQHAVCLLACLPACLPACLSVCLLPAVVWLICFIFVRILVRVHENTADRGFRDLAVDPPHPLPLLPLVRLGGNA